jgi:magnesium-transporting ATPase (P-type)
VEDGRGRINCNSKITVSTATDVAKAAAGMVLTEAGLAGIVAAVMEGRITFQRIQTYPDLVGSDDRIRQPAGIEGI